MAKKHIIYGEEFRKIVLKEYKAAKNAKIVAKKYGISPITIYRWEEERKYLDKTSPIKQKDRDCSRSGRKSPIPDQKDFINFVESNPTLTQKEIALKYGAKIDKELTEHQVRRLLKKLKITRKKIKPYFKESNQKECEEFIEKINKEDAKKVIFIDESYVRQEDYQRYGYSRRGKVIQKAFSGGNRKTMGIIAGLLNNKIIAPMCFEGYCHAPTFECWFEEELASKLSPGHVLVMDNAAIHNKKRLSNIAEKYNHKVFFCPHTRRSLIK